MGSSAHRPHGVEGPPGSPEHRIGDGPCEQRRAEAGHGCAGTKDWVNSTGQKEGKFMGKGRRPRVVAGDGH
eukprot:9388436-Karenia_brevis.AAC.1